MSTLNVSYRGQDGTKKIFYQGETVDMICELDNSRCTLNATCVKLQLYQRIILRDRFGKFKFLNRLVNERRENGIYQAGQETTHKISLSIQDLDNPTIEYVKKCDHRNLFKDEKLVSCLQASSKSTMIECTYYLNVATEWASTLCCSGRPTIEIPILVYIPSEIRRDVNEFKPQNWNPVSMPSCTLNNFEKGLNLTTNVNANIGGINMTSSIPAMTTSTQAFNYQK